MKIAYLILCHKNSVQVNSLLRQLNNDNVDFYIHIDKKSRMSALNNRSNTIVLNSKKCVDVKWASFSMIEATLNLCATANKMKKSIRF